MDDCEQTSSIVEEGMGDVSVKKRHRKNFLYSQILKQMEFYFSDANLCRDRFMSQYLAKSDGIPIEVFLNFNKIRELNCDLKDIAKALRSSELIYVSEDGKSVSRKTKVKQKKNQDDCIIYVEQLPPDANHEWVIGIFSAYGKVEYVSIPKFKNKPVIKGFAFVEFDTPEAAKRALEAFGSVGSCLPQQMQPEELCSIATFEEDKDEEQGVAESQQQDDDGEKTKRKAIKSKHDTHLDESSTVQESEDDNSEPKSKKVKMEDSSSELKEKRKSKRSETSTISQGVSENIAENEEKEEVEEDEEKNSFASKKGKKRKNMSEITDMEKNEGGEMYADNESQSKKKKKHSSVEETENVHTEYLYEGSKEGDAPEKKKKKKKQNCEDGDYVNESEEGMELDHNQEVCDAQYSKKKKNKNKPEDGDIHENEEGIELDDNQDVLDTQHSKKKKKKKRKSVEKDNDIEDVDDDEGTAPKEKTDDNEEEVENEGREEADEHLGEASAKKKRSRKRNKDKKKNKKGEDPTFGLRIISKNEWRRLRNKYLNLQREKMVALKKHLARRQYGSVHQSPFSSQDNYRQNVRVDSQIPKTGGQVKPEKISFTPGVIMKINLASPLTDVTSFKTSARLCEDVAYVDANEGDTEVYLRCSSSDGVQKLFSEHKWENMNVLEGDEEKKYWEKIFEDRTSKFKNKGKVKVRGKDKLMKRAERELGKHIKFDD